MTQSTAQLFSSGLESAYLVASSGLLSSSWKLVSDLYAENNSNGELFWKKVINESDLTMLAFVTTQLHLQPDLVPSSDLMDNSFDFLFSARNPTFSLNHSVISLFYKYRPMLQQLKSQIDVEKPLIVTGHAVGGSIASLFTLWLLGSVDPREEHPFCITFGSPLIGDQSLQKVVSRSSKWNSSFLHVASLEDPLPSSFISTCSYKPFGTVLLCSDEGSACLENPDTTWRLVHNMSPTNQGFKSPGYGYVVENLERNAICKDSTAPNISTLSNGLQASLALQLWELGLTTNNLVKEMERDTVLFILRKRKHFIPNRKLDEMETYMAQMEWYKKTCKNRRRGYYDSYKNFNHAMDTDVVMFVKILNNYWEDMVEEVTMQPQKEGAAFRTKWLYAGTSYRRMVEPLDIARYYEEGGIDYVNRGRSQHYKMLEKWLKDDKNPDPQSKQNVESLLTMDSCFWAHVEEALISCQQVKEEGFGLEEKEDAREKLEEFENYVYGLLRKYKVSPEIFLEHSSFMRWWNEYKGIVGSSYESRLANFMRNPANYARYAEGRYDFPYSFH